MACLEECLHVGTEGALNLVVVSPCDSVISFIPKFDKSLKMEITPQKTDLALKFFQGIGDWYGRYFSQHKKIAYQNLGSEAEQKRKRCLKRKLT